MENTEKTMQAAEKINNQTGDIAESIENSADSAQSTKQNQQMNTPNTETKMVKHLENLLNSMPNEQKENNTLQNPYIKDYMEIKKNFGEPKAKEYLEFLKTQQTKPLQDIDGNKNQEIHKILSENNSIMNEINEKFAKELAIPCVKEAFDLFMDMDIDHNQSYSEQNVVQVMQQAAKVYNEGYNAGLESVKLTTEAKSRLNSSVVSSQESSSSARTFSRKDIANMDTATFSENEEEIFNQLKKGLIK